ncbi:MAG: formylglycine-generating enzyme family protein [Chloroflexi bacterium]|nr:formylglycine-generating enzyme family protein [Chloroflexota bacterium]
MKRLPLVALCVLLALAVGCAPSPATPTAPPSPTHEPIVVLPTSTPVPPPPTPTFTPAPTPAAQATPTPAAPTQATPTAAAPAKLTVPMIAIPASEFTMGSEREIERPPHKVPVPAFEIDQFEVTNEQFARFVKETAYKTTAEKTGDSSTWSAYAEGKPNHPVVKVSWNDAVAYCQWLGKRLPTEAEWEKAARGTDERLYPWGNEWALGKANTKEAGYRGTTIVGSLPGGASPYGVMDMAGNVAEWTSDWFQPYPGYPGGDSAAQFFGQKYRVIRGGGWFSDKEMVRTTTRSCSSVDLANDDVGFRCAR